MHFVRLAYKLVPEIGVRNADEHIGTLPSRATCEVHGAVFGDDVKRLTSRRRDNIAVKRRNYAAFKLALAILVGAAHADKRLTVAAHACTGHKVELTARAAYLPCSGAFGGNLSEKVGGNAGVYGDHVFVCGDDVRVVYV